MLEVLQVGLVDFCERDVGHSVRFEVPVELLRHEYERAEAVGHS